MPYLNPMLDALSPANIWFIAGILLLIFEMFTPGFFLASLSVGTFLAALIAWAGGDDTWQLVGFILGGALSLVALRPTMKRYFDANGIATNADALVGRKAKVTAKVPAGEHGSIQIDGDTWTIECPEDLKEGDQIQVVARQSIILQVKRLG
ncbi:MAG TPA: NfeD family protein [Cryomorphaceae bacterium]|jgi:membrane protein implicated in regulation of membrane protease activity|nr:NfeD family protein [Cryomorphaceae bacterium]HAG49482.1 NfeD family protein [Cryomorphaceae bacterium]|tara:strand:- start:2189 stop:2641 length:453 start_codon:yes stop_codon:yes gene_type:complete